MNRKIKTLGLALLTTLALTAVMASTASANFTSSAAHTVLSGSQVESHKFTAGTGIGAINCTTVSFSGTAAASSEPTQVVTPTYANCKDSLGRTVDVNTSSAEYMFTSTAGKGLFHIIGGHITITVTGSTNCVITITAQNNKNNVAYTQEGNHLKYATGTNNIHTHISGGGFACGTESKTCTNGTYTGTTLMKGDGGVAKISVH